MTSNHIQRGFVDNSRIDTVAVSSYEKPTLIGKIMLSQKKRSTETAAEELIEDGKQHEATDTKGEWKAAGLVQCKRCGIPQEEGTAEDPKDYRFYKKEGVPYRCQYCKDCETEMRRTRRFSQIIPLNPYPERLS